MPRNLNQTHRRHDKNAWPLYDLRFMERLGRTVGSAEPVPDNTERRFVEQEDADGEV